MKRFMMIARVLIVLAVANLAAAQVTRLAPPSNTSGFVYPEPGELAVIPNWVVDVDEGDRFDVARRHCIVVDEPGEFLIFAAVQWSLQNIAPYTGNEPQRGSRYVSLWRLPDGGTPIQLGEGVVVPVNDFVTKHSVTAQASLETDDCVFVGVAQTATAPIPVVGTSFWLAPVAQKRTLLDWWRARTPIRRSRRPN